MVYRVTFRPETEGDFERLDSQVAQRVLRKIRWLSENFTLVTPQPLKGEWKGKFKLRVGDYRVVYSVNEEEERITCPHGRASTGDIQIIPCCELRDPLHCPGSAIVCRPRSAMSYQLY